MKVAEWYSINDIVYQKAAYVAFDSNQRKELWLSKLQETLKLDWTNAEKEHISKLIYLIEDNSNLFDNKVSVDDKTDLAIYQWKEYALEQLRWDHELIFSIIKTPEKLNANKNWIQASIKLLLQKIIQNQMAINNHYVIVILMNLINGSYAVFGSINVI